MKTNFKRIGKQSISIVLAVMMMLSTMLVGMVTSNASGTYTVYFTPGDGWSTVKVNCNRQNKGNNWYNFTATDTNNTISGKKVYKADLDLPDDGVYKMEFNNESTYVAVINDTWTNASVFSGKYWNGSEWVDPVWDTQATTTTYYVAGQTSLVGGNSDWSTGDYNIMKYDSTTGIYSKTFNNVNAGTYQFKFTDKTNWIGERNFTMTSEGCIENNGFTFTNGNFQIITTENANITITYDGKTTVTVKAASTASKPKVTVNYNADHVSSITLNSTAVTLNGQKVEVDNNSKPTLIVTTNDGYRITSVTQDDTTLTGSNGTYTLNAVTADTTITVTTEATSTPSSSNTVYLKNSDNWKEDFHVYAWKDDSNKNAVWSDMGDSEKMTYVRTDSDGAKIYKYENSNLSNWTNIIFRYNSLQDKSKDLSNNPLGGYMYDNKSDTWTVYSEPATDYTLTWTAPTDNVSSATISNSGTVTAGTEVTVTVNVNNGYEATLDLGKVTVNKTVSGNQYTFKFNMPAKNITVAPKVTKAGGTTGTEIQGLYLIYSRAKNDGNPTGFTEFLNLYYDSNNQVYAYFDESNFDTSKTYYFTISNSKGESTSWEYAYDNYNNSKAFANESNKKYLECGQSVYNLPKKDHEQYESTAFAKFKVLDAYVGTISSVKINLGYYNGTDIVESSTDSTTKATTYEVIPTISGAVEGMPQVFAKDGTIRTGYQKYADMADTVLTAENTADLTKYAKKDYYETAYAKVGTKLKITTTIDDKYKDTYFVKAFSINGYSYGIIDASQAKKQNGVYTCEYTIPEDFKGSRIEITPIYYYIDDKDTVTFYVEGFDETVQEMWGNTIAVQAWYENGVEGGESGSDTKNALGGYPGQPLVYQGGKYSMQIPKHLNGKQANKVSGITLNNYFWDEIHKENFSNKRDDSEFNCQTYDYDDFYKLSETADVDNIIFDFRYRTTTDNDPKQDLRSSTYKESELELLKDYSGNIVNIFGNILSEDLTADYKNNHLTVISNGYAKITGIGNYATEWSVYAPDGTYINKINCSSLINENKVDTDDYKVAYNQLKQYKDLPVMIAYEKSLYGGNDKGTRADGRWYFSKKADTITAKVEIEYGANSSSEFSKDEFLPDSNVGENTRAQAYFTNAGYSGKTTCDGTVDGGNFSVHAETDANAKYYFLGWYLKTSDGYSFITNESDADFPMTNNETYVARFINTPSGTLTLSHTLLDGSAYGKTFIKADIVDSNGKVIKPFEETSGNIVIPSSYVNYASEYKIVATLKTVPYGKDEVEGFYNSDQVRYTHVAAGEKTCVVSTTIKELFKEIENTDGSVSHNLKKSNIPFYSKITSKPLEYSITYTYDTRLNKKQSYVIKDTVSGIELEQIWDENKEQLSKAFIIRKAPFVSNYREEIKWNMDEAVIDGYKATVLAKTSPVKDLNISAWKVDGQWTQPATVKYGELAKSNGDYLYKIGTKEFPEKFNEYDFSFWAIFDNKEKADQYRKEVVAYMSGKPAEVMSDRLTALTKLKGYDNLISKSYSKEYNYISYQDYYIVPVYAGRFEKSKINESQASIRLLKYTRNQWTTGDGVKGDGETLNTGATKTDYLYTDFALSFDKDQLLIKNNPNIKVGIALEVVAQYNDINDFKNYGTDSNKEEIGKLVKAATHNGNAGSYEFNSDNRAVYRYEINKSDVSVKNRIEYYLEFDNDDKAQQYVMKVYSYIYDTHSGDIYLSDPEYMNMYDIGNLTYITSGLASINLQPATVLG